MRWEKKVTDPCNWHRCFAWFPIKVADTWIWLEFYEYREDHLEPVGGYIRLIDK